jgi:hypothetical protein
VNSTRTQKRRGAVIVLAASCLLAMLGLTQCKMVPDTVVGPNRGRSGPAGTCFRDCADQYSDSLKAEGKLHKDNLKDCKRGGGGGDRDDDDNRIDGGFNGRHGRGRGDNHRDRDCINEENDRHEAAVERILEGLRQCQAGCHHQGGGTGR